MSTSNKNIESMNWQEVPNAELGWDEANPKDEAEEVKKHQKAEEAEKRACEVEEVRQREAAMEAERRAKVDDNNNDDDDVVVVSTCKASKSESRAWETLMQVVDRWMGEVVEELWGLRKGVTMMAKANQDLAQVLYCRFQSVDMLVNKVQIFRAKGYLPKPAMESKASEDKLQEALWEVKKLQEEWLEWAMEYLQMRKEWMWQEEATLTKHLKGKGKE
ncbi:hypothetical protein ID866_9550 [Astraeus odoratus]|nr:hypothetical protein ID866_9550 [Astraeus odoratus]